MKLAYVSIPKSGTHLLLHVFNRPRKNVKSSLSPHGQWAVINQHQGRHMIGGHILPTTNTINEMKHRKTIFLYRETRQDWCVSYCHFNNTPGELLVGPMFPHLTGKAYTEADDKLLWVIQNMRTYYDTMMQWKSIADVVLTYEGLMQEPEKQLEPLVDILEEPLDVLVERSKFRGGKTYRKGVIGNWENVFHMKHREAFARVWT